MPGEPIYFSRTNITDPGTTYSGVYKEQAIEDVRTLNGQDVTLSFWAKANASKDMRIWFLQYFGTAGSPSPGYYFGGSTVSLTTSWQYFTVTVTVPSIAGKTLGTDNKHFLGVTFVFSGGSGNSLWTTAQTGTFDLAQIKLERGSTATEFVERSYQEELALCQRYYEKSFLVDTTPASNISTNQMRINLVAVGANAVSNSISFKVEKRRAPTVVAFNPSTASAGTWRWYDGGGNPSDASPTFADVGTHSFVAYRASTTQVQAYAQWTADAEL